MCCVLNYRGISHKITDHETSQSSDRDTLRQRFSVATHPYLPIFLCSDGYSVTVLKLPSSLSLPDLLYGLVSKARELLDLPTIEANDRDEAIAQRSLSVDSGRPQAGGIVSHSLQLQSLHDVATSFVEDTATEDVLCSTLDSTAGPGFLSAMTGVDAGGIHFAGLGSTLELTRSSLQVQMESNKLEQALSLLLCGSGLLLSCGLLYPGDGISTLVRSLDLVAVESCQSRLKRANSILISTVLEVVDVLYMSDEESGTTTVQGFLEVLFSLVPLDSLQQSHLSTVAMLANGILITMSKGCLSKHETFAAVKKENHTLQTLIEYFSNVAKDLNEISELLDNTIALLENTYSLQPVSTTSSVFHTPALLTSNSAHNGDCVSSLMSCLSPSCDTLVKVSALLQQDVKVCQNIIKKRLRKACQGSNLQSREMGVLCNKVTTCLNEALVALQHTHAQVRCIINNKLLKSGVNKDGNPITSVLQEDSKISKLRVKLEQYDIQGAMEYTHSLLGQHDTDAAGTSFDSSSIVSSKEIRDVVLFLAQTMSAFFCEQAPVITVPVITDTLYSEHVMVLSRNEISKAIRNVAVSELWTVDHTLELLLLSHSWIEACEFLKKLGDWKKAFSLAAIVVHHSRLLNAARKTYAPLKRFAHQLATDGILATLGLKINSGFSVREPVAKLDSSVLVSKSRLISVPDLGSSRLLNKDVVHFITETLRACAFAELDSVLLTISTSVVMEITHWCKQLSTEVPVSVYLPAPPLFCPQPTVQDEVCLERCSYTHDR